jgi:hypothetical protein
MVTVMAKRERQDEDSEGLLLDAVAQGALETELLNACKSGTVAEVKAALRKGASLHATRENGRTALMEACSREPGEEAVGVAKLLLRLKCPVGVVCRRGRRKRVGCGVQFFLSGGGAAAA